MSELPQNESAVNDRPNENGQDNLPDELPPVEPPSAGFIVQLFVVPGLIVLAIVAVWALFGKLASSEQDWRQLVAELKNSNEHRRWRGASGLAQVLKADAELGPDGQQLSKNQEIAGELAGLLDKELESPSHKEEDVKQQTFLARALGMLDVPDVVFPVLNKALGPQYDREVRKSAAISIALIAERKIQRDETFDSPEVIDGLVQLSSDSDPVLKQTGAFTLGLFSGSQAQDRLEVLLSDADVITRVNAAIGLARHESTEGYTVFQEVLADSMQEAPQTEASPDSEQQGLKPDRKLTVLRNILRAVDRLSEHFSVDQRREMAKLLESLADDHPAPRIRIDARTALASLDGQ